MTCLILTITFGSVLMLGGDILMQKIYYYHLKRKSGVTLQFKTSSFDTWVSLHFSSHCPQRS